MWWWTKKIKIGLAASAVFCAIALPVLDGQITVFPPMVITADSANFKGQEDGPPITSTANGLLRCYNLLTKRMPFWASSMGLRQTFMAVPLTMFWCSLMNKLNAHIILFSGCFPDRTSLSVPGSYASLTLVSPPLRIAGSGCQPEYSGRLVPRFLVRNEHLIKAYDHNHLRITGNQVTLSSGDEAAEWFKASVIDLQVMTFND